MEVLARQIVSPPMDFDKGKSTTNGLSLRKLSSGHGIGLPMNATVDDVL
jgi:hypothetical protein